jgi:hypothetical protein
MQLNGMICNEKQSQAYLISIVNIPLTPMLRTLYFLVLGDGFNSNTNANANANVIANSVAEDSPLQGVNLTDSKRRVVRSIFNTSSHVDHATSEVAAIPIFLHRTTDTIL